MSYSDFMSTNTCACGVSLFSGTMGQKVNLLPLAPADSSKYQLASLVNSGGKYLSYGSQ
jgi:hypothetical protein